MSMFKGLMMGAVAGLMALSPASPTAAAEAAVPKAASANPAAQGATDFSAVRRRHYHRRGPNGAALAIMGAATGLIAGAIAEQRRRDYYEDHYYYGPRPYYGGPAYYGGGPYYGPRYYPY
jgi:hypothetical protein